MSLNADAQIITALEQLPHDGLTVAALKALDNVVPGSWDNITDFDRFVIELAETDKPRIVGQIRERASALQVKPRYTRGLALFRMVDTVDQVAAGATVASKVGGLLSGLAGGRLGFLDKLAPKPVTTQCIDAGLKLAVELLAFGVLNGIPTTKKGSLTRFAGALEDYARYDLMRIAAWVVFDGLIPLGPHFLQQILSTFDDASTSGALSSNRVFAFLGRDLPGDNVDQKRGFVRDALARSGDWMERFIADKQLTQAGAVQKLQGALSVAAHSGDMLAAAIDASTAYYSHTGTQTVARTLARHAVEAQRRGVWRRWVKAQ